MSLLSLLNNVYSKSHMTLTTGLFEYFYLTTKKFKIVGIFSSFSAWCKPLLV